nr:MAG TPA: hypothetical protein [Caudoviricetes sp.]
MPLNPHTGPEGHTPAVLTWGFGGYPWVVLLFGGLTCFGLVVLGFLWIVQQVWWWCGLQSGVVF